MNTDIELLELAAKAAGIKLGWYTPYALLGDFRQIPDWNPLTDDGDALRLSVKLKMTVTVDDDAYTVVEAALFDKAIFVDAVERHKKSDQYAATRRAIVRAAAEIGKTK